MDSAQNGVNVVLESPMPVVEVPKKKKPGACCVCKPTKKLRDDCIFNFSEEKCVDFISAHKECMASWGYIAK